MCGIFGYSFKEGAVSEGCRAILASKLAEENDGRGGHSWGYVKLDEGLVIDRGLGLLGSCSHKLVGAREMFAHTRWATHGAKTIDNAHPFEVGDIVGAHNGIIYNHTELCALYDRKFEVDSKHLFAHLDEDKPFDEIEGYGAIEWVDKKQPGMRIARLDGGELSVYGIGKHGGEVLGIVWSSSEKHLKHALRCSGLKQHFEYDIDDGQVYSVRDGDIWIVPQKLQLAQWERDNKGNRLEWFEFGNDTFGKVTDIGISDEKDDEDDEKDVPDESVSLDWESSRSRALTADEEEDEVFDRWYAKYKSVNG